MFRRAFPLLVALALAGCGGGVYLGYEWGDDGLPPSVELVASAYDVVPLQSVRLVAAAADDTGYIDQVEFYRFDGNRPVLLGIDRAPPYENILVVPADGRTHVDVFARAVDSFGDVGDSAIISLTVR